MGVDGEMKVKFMRPILLPKYHNLCILSDSLVNGLHFQIWALFQVYLTFSFKAQTSNHTF